MAKKHEEVIDLSNAADHPGLDPISKTGDESFRVFMGAPIMHHGRTKRISGIFRIFATPLSEMVGR